MLDLERLSQSTGRRISEWRRYTNPAPPRLTALCRTHCPLDGNTQITIQAAVCDETRRAVYVPRYTPWKINRDTYVCVLVVCVLCLMYCVLFIGVY